MNNDNNKIGIIREQGEFNDFVPLTEEDEKIVREQFERDKKDKEDK